MIRYNEELLRAMRKADCDAQTFFRIAHIHQFGSDAVVTTDLEQFKLHAIVPPYVCKYLQHIKETTP